jgi:hypothetical protein
MKRLLIVGFVSVLAGSAFAQGVSVQIGPQERTRIKEYVVKEKRPATKFPSGFSFSIGSTIPQEVEVYDIPDHRDHAYVIVEGKPVLVERRTRRVIEYVD